MDVDCHVLLSQAREVECCRHGVRFFVVTDIHPTVMIVIVHSLDRNGESLTSGGRRPAAGPGAILGC